MSLKALPPAPALCDACQSPPAPGKSLLRCGRCKLVWHCHSIWKKHVDYCSHLQTELPPLRIGKAIKTHTLEREVRRLLVLLKKVVSSWSGLEERRPAPDATHKDWMDWAKGFYATPPFLQLLGHHFPEEYTLPGVGSGPSPKAKTYTSAQLNTCAYIFLLHTLAKCKSVQAVDSLVAELEEPWEFDSDYLPRREGIPPLWGPKIFRIPCGLVQGEYESLIAIFADPDSEEVFEEATGEDTAGGNFWTRWWIRTT